MQSARPGHGRYQSRMSWQDSTGSEFTALLSLPARSNPNWSYWTTPSALGLSTSTSPAPSEDGSNSGNQRRVSSPKRSSSRFFGALEVMRTLAMARDVPATVYDNVNKSMVDEMEAVSARIVTKWLAPPRQVQPIELRKLSRCVAFRAIPGASEYWGV